MKTSSIVTLSFCFGLLALMPDLHAADQSEPSLAGLLVVHPDNPRYVMVCGDARGRAVCLIGAHTWAEFQTYRQETFDYDDWIGAMSNRNYNFVRGWTWEDGFYAPLPYAKVGDKYDLEQFNSAFFDRMKRRIRLAGRRGLYVSVMLFQGWSVLGESRARVPAPWLRHPFHRDNNINGIDGDLDRDHDGEEIHSLRDPKITKLQEAYVRHFIDELNELDNIVWEIGNECSRDSAAWQYHMIDVIKKYEATRPKQHLVWANLFPDECFVPQCHADLVSPRGSRPYFRNPPAADGSKVVVADSDHISPLQVTYDWAWKSFTRGLHPILMDCSYQELTWWKGRPFQPEHPKWQQLHKALSVISAYAERINLAAMIPQAAEAASPSGTRFCLYDRGKEYLIYQPAGETAFTVELPRGTYQAEWINPVAGPVKTQTVESDGGAISMTAPFPWPAVLYLRATQR